MTPLRRVGDFTAPKDEATGVELRRQLLQFQSNVSTMGDQLQAGLLSKLSPNLPPTTGTTGPVVSPGQFHVADTRAGTVNIAFAKPSAADTGSFLVLIDLGGSAGAFFVQAQGCKYENAATGFLTVSTYAALVFCDGVDYWRIF